MKLTMKLTLKVNNQRNRVCAYIFLIFWTSTNQVKKDTAFDDYK